MASTTTTIMKDINYRAARHEDFDFIYDLYMEPDANPFLTFDLMDKQSFYIIYKNLINSATLFIAECNHQGVGTFQIIPYLFRQSDTVYIAGFTIKSSFKGQGFGREMMAYIIDTALKTGKKRLELTVAIDNKRAINLYTKAGFIKEGIKRKNYKLNTGIEYLDEILMAYIF
ncbi:MAG: hypothetical protein NVS9B7_10310 [Flavisolibacter sp.]